MGHSNEIRLWRSTLGLPLPWTQIAAVNNFCLTHSWNGIVEERILVLEEIKILFVEVACVDGHFGRRCSSCLNEVRVHAMMGGQFGEFVFSMEFGCHSELKSAQNHRRSSQVIAGHLFDAF
eukprot:scaffold1903_cov126-Skeletonema_marinoi.AAC.8